MLKEFIGKMGLKWFFRDKPAKNSSERLAFRVKPNLKPPRRHHAAEMFLSKLEKRSSLCFLVLLKIIIYRRKSS